MSGSRYQAQHLFFLKINAGQAALSLVLVISGIVLISGIALLFLINSFTSATLGFRSANRALAIASSGAEDALLRIVRDVRFPGPVALCGGNPPVSTTDPPYPLYEVPVGNDVARVRVENGVCGGTSQAVITAEATVGNYKRKIEVIAAIDLGTGRVDVVSWKQVVF